MSLYNAAPFVHNNISIYNNDISGEEGLDFINNCSITNHLITIKGKIINDLRNNEDENIIKKKIEEYKNFQEEYLKIEQLLNDETIKTNENIKTLIDWIKILNNINSKYFKVEREKEGEDGKEMEIIKKIKNNIYELTEEIKNNNNISEIKEKFNEKRKKLLSYLKLIKIINNFNLGSTCSICMNNNVNKYLNPCGHTACDECLKNYNNKCFICRKDIINISPLYFI